MSTENFIENLAERLGQTATVKNVFGEPVQAGDKTIIPVAQIAYGCGGGFGQGKNKLIHQTEPSGAMQGAPGEGAGGGGGMFAKARGVYEITPSSTKFIPASNTRPLIAGIVLGFLIRALLSGKRR